MLHDCSYSTATTPTPPPILLNCLVLLANELRARWEAFREKGLGRYAEARNDAADLAIGLKLNGEQRQSSRTSKMIFDVKEIIHQLSAGFTLLPGDVIMTGTPEGVGYAMQPPQTMTTGDVMELTIEGIGTLTNAIGA